MRANVQFALYTVSACLILPTQVRSEIHGDIPPGYTNLTRVAEYFGKMRDEEKLPGLSKNEHGKANLYPLTPDLKKQWREEKLLNDTMLSDVAGCNEAYVMAIETEKSERFLRYFFCVENRKIRLASAYHFPNGHWVKLSPKEKPPATKNGPKDNRPR